MILKVISAMYLQRLFYNVASMQDCLRNLWLWFKRYFTVNFNAFNTCRYEVYEAMSGSYDTKYEQIIIVYQCISKKYIYISMQ
jgi:hypothetical protein